LQLVKFFSLNLLVHLIYRRFKINNSIMILKEQLPPESNPDNLKYLLGNIKSSGHYFPLLCELALCLVHSLPLVNLSFMVPMEEVEIEYTLDMFCTLVSILRIYLGWRYFVHFSRWNGQTNEAAGRTCEDSKCQGGAIFALKCELKERPYTLVSIAVTISILIFGFAMRAAEL
jgi:hypothetical protein